MPPLTPSDSSAPGTNPSDSSAPNPTPGPVPSDPASDVPGHTPLKAPHILLINAAAFVHTCKLEGSFQFSLQLAPLNLLPLLKLLPPLMFQTYLVSCWNIMNSLTSSARPKH
ncbi:hypothetical protein ID866_11168 [Astraeus odoratus]|nr:hypothetical protein ID866_11168 [Astraeus odoratus]